MLDIVHDWRCLASRFGLHSQGPSFEYSWAGPRFGHNRGEDTKSLALPVSEHGTKNKHRLIFIYLFITACLLRPTYLYINLYHTSIHIVVYFLLRNKNQKQPNTLNLGKNTRHSTVCLIHFCISLC